MAPTSSSRELGGKHGAVNGTSTPSLAAHSIKSRGSLLNGSKALVGANRQNEAVSARTVEEDEAIDKLACAVYHADVIGGRAKLL